MKNLHRILENCLMRLSTGTTTLDECLGLYPEHAEQLKPLLKTALLLNSKHNLMPSPTFRAFARFAIIRFAQSHPRQPRGIAFSWRTAATLAVLVVALLVTGTAHAQSAMPGDMYYDWKRTSELAWRALSPNLVAVDVILSERRLTEWIAVADDPMLSISARKNYQEALSRLEPEDDAESLELIVSELQSQQQKLKKAGLPTVELDNYLAEVFAPVVPVTGAGPATTDVHVITTDVPATEVPIGITIDECPPHCGNNQGGVSQGGGMNRGDERGKKGDDRENKGKKEDHGNNGRGPK